jgi:hypothetical protein
MIAAVTLRLLYLIFQQVVGLILPGISNRTGPAPLTSQRNLAPGTSR